MADDRTIAPDPGRWRRAWRAGLRPRSRWLLPAVAMGLVALGLDGLVTDSRGPGLDVRPGAMTPQTWLSEAAGGLAAGWSLAALVVVAVALMSRQLGGISEIDRRRLGATVHPAGLSRSLLGLLAVVGASLAVLGVLAGAARAVDASELGLSRLWLSWAARGSAATAAVMGLAALAELVIDHRDRWRALLRSRQQVRDEARAAGGR